MKPVESEEDMDEGFSVDVILSDSEEAPSPLNTNLGLRVALPFINRKRARKSKRKSDAKNKKQLKANGRSSEQIILSDSEDEDHASNQENSSVLLKRAMNIQENKAVLAQLLSELHSMPNIFPVKTPSTTPSKQKKTPRKTFVEGPLERRTNPTRNARPPENFALENFTMAAVQFAEHFNKYGKKGFLKRTMSEEEREEFQKRRRTSKNYSVRTVEDITEEELQNVADSVKDKIYDKIVGSTCHQCRQKTVDTKTVCRNPGCGGVKGQFCGPCLRNRYGEDVREALLDPDWICPPCRDICNCSYCRKRGGRCATGMLIHLAKFYGYSNVKEYLESLQKQMVDD